VFLSVQRGIPDSVKARDHTHRFIDCVLVILYINPVRIESGSNRDAFRILSVLVNFIASGIFLSFGQRVLLKGLSHQFEFG
jgi:hypothetical protein